MKLNMAINFKKNPFFISPFISLLISLSLFFSLSALNTYAQDEEMADKSKQEKLAQFYIVELTVFTNDNPENVLEEEWHNNITLSYPDNLAILSNKTIEDIYPELTHGRVALPVSNSFSFLPLLGSLNLTHVESVRRIEESDQHRVLFNKVWLQKLDFENAAVNVAIQGGQQQGGIFELGGSIKLFKTDYLNLETRLWLVGFSPLPSTNSNIKWPMPPQLEINNYDVKVLKPIKNNNILRITPLNNKRAIRGGKLYYIDHPLFGLLIELRPHTFQPTP